MIETLTLKWLSNALLSDTQSFKDRFMQTFDESKYNAFTQLLKESLAAQQLIQLMNHIDQKLTILVFPYVLFISQNENQINTEFWTSILRNDIKLDNRSASCNGSTIDDCVTGIVDFLLNSYWTQNSFLELATMINCCAQAGAPIDRTKLQIFTYMESTGIYPVDFPTAVLNDYIGTTYSILSYILNAYVTPIYTFLKDELNFTVSSYTTHIDLIKSLALNKLKSNIYDEVQIAKYGFIEQIFSQLQIIYFNYLSPIVESQEWSFIPYGQQAFIRVMLDFFKSVIEIDSSDYDDFKTKLQDLINTYDFQTKLEDTFVNLWNTYRYQRKAFDKSKIQDYFNEVLDKSDDTSHIHFALYPIFQLVCECQDVASNDYLFATYNALNDIQKLSNFEEVDIDDYVVREVQQTYSSLPEVESLVAIIRQSLQDVYNKLDNIVTKYELQDPFYQFYVTYQRLVMTVLGDTYSVLLQPLYSELQSVYNLTSFEEFKQAVESRIYQILASQSGQVLQNITTITQDEREKISSDDYDSVLTDLYNGTSKTLTMLLKQISSNIFDRYTEVIDFTSFKEDIKLAIINTLYEYAGQSNLMFDILSGNLQFLQSFDTYYGYFESAFKNKLKFEIRKYITQLEHTFIGNAYALILTLDKLSYWIQPLLANSFELAIRLQRLLSTTFLYLDRIRYESSKAMQLPIYLSSCYTYLNKILEYMSNSNFYIGLLQSTLEV